MPLLARRSTATTLARLGAAVALVSGCASTTGGPPPPAPAEPGDAVVRLVGLEFEPRTIEVPIGTRVRWEWTDSVVHNVVSKDFASSRELSDGAHAVRFDRAGTFPYTCTLHAGMDGTVVVRP